VVGACIGHAAVAHCQDHHLWIRQRYGYEPLYLSAVVLSSLHDSFHVSPPLLDFPVEQPNGLQLLPGHNQAVVDEFHV
jgi:hypothetical protein